MPITLAATPAMSPLGLTVLQLSLVWVGPVIEPRTRRELTQVGSGIQDVIATSDIVKSINMDEEEESKTKIPR